MFPVVVGLIVVVALIGMCATIERKRYATSNHWHNASRGSRYYHPNGRYAQKKGLKMEQVDREDLEYIGGCLEEAESSLQGAIERCEEALEEVNGAQKVLDAILYPKEASKWEV